MWEFGRPYPIALTITATVFIWIERVTGVWCGSSGLCPAGGLTVGIMKNGKYGQIMGRRLLMIDIWIRTTGQFMRDQS